MVLIKDDGKVPEDFLDFEEIFKDINSPGIFIAKTDDNMKDRAIILDGHSTLLIYSSKNKDLSWEAYRDQGSYTYTPDAIGDGAVLFPHNFYFEVSVELSNRVVDLAASFNGSGINAIVMPMNGVVPVRFTDILKERLENTFTSVLKPLSLTTIAGATLELPDNAKSDLSFKLAILGISLESMKVLSEVELPEEAGTVVQKIYDTPPETTKIIEELREDKKKKRKKVKKSPDPPPPQGKPIPSAIKTKDVPSAEMPPAPTGRGSGGPPGPSSIPSPGGAPKPAPSVVPAAPSLPKVTPVKAKKRSLAAKEEVLSSVGESEEAVLDEDSEIDDIDLLPPKLREKEYDAVKQKKFTKTSYFDRMLPNRSYRLELEIASKEIIEKASVKSIISGERAAEMSGSFEIENLQTPVTIRPQFPGCLVVPTEITVDAAKDVLAEFYVTPLTLGKLDAQINFYQNGKKFHTISLMPKVITHRLSKLAGYAGIVATALPTIFAFIVGEDPAAWLDFRLNLFLPALVPLGYFVPLITGGALAGGGVLLRFMRRPTSRSTNLVFPR